MRRSGRSSVRRRAVETVARAVGPRRRAIACRRGQWRPRRRQEDGRGYERIEQGREKHARRLLYHTELDAILWANIRLKLVTFTTITGESL